MNSIKRRDFLKTAAAATATGALVPSELMASQFKATIYVVHGTDIKKMLATGIAKMGGFKKFVKQGKKCTVKANVSWPSKPFQAANTHPDLVGETVRSCIEAGASKVVVPENLVPQSGRAFEISGTGAAVKKAGGHLYATDDSHFQKVTIPGGKTLKSCEVVKDVLHTDCLINMPVTKHHGGAGLTLSMKNWMGSVKDRHAWHKGELHQCIADFSTLIKPDLIIADATTIMLSNGPQGPGETTKPNQIILGTDPVAVDAYSATLFKKKPFEIEHIKIAHQMGIGCGNLAEVKIIELKTS